MIRLITCVAAFAVAPLATGQEADPAALKELRSFLFDTNARRDFAKGKADATASNNFLEAFPSWAQTELLDIIVSIATESGLGASQHVSSYQNGGAEAAKNSFSPAVQSRIDALFKKLQSDPSFNNPSNLNRMQSLMPQGNRS